MNKQLLIVDDDLPFRERLSRSMEKKGFIVNSFANSADTLKSFDHIKFDYAIEFNGFLDHIAGLQNNISLGKINSCRFKKNRYQL